MEEKVAEKQRGSEEEEEKSRGFLRNLISNMVCGEENGEEKESGFLKNFISSMVYAEEGEGGEENKEKEDGGIARNAMVSQGESHKTGSSESVRENGGGDGGGGGGSIIDNIVSHLPSSLQGDAVTTTDEATILIHSIIHE